MSQETAVDYLLRVLKSTYGDHATDLIQEEITLIKRLYRLQMQNSFIAGGQAAWNAARNREFQTFDDYFDDMYKTE